MCSISAVSESSRAVFIKDNGDVHARVHLEETLRLEGYTEVFNGHTIMN